jgi:hypothetical protein
MGLYFTRGRRIDFSKAGPFERFLVHKAKGLVYQKKKKHTSLFADGFVPRENYCYWLISQTIRAFLGTKHTKGAISLCVLQCFYLHFIWKHVDLAILIFPRFNSK